MIDMFKWSLILKNPFMNYKSNKEIFLTIIINNNITEYVQIFLVLLLVLVDI